METFKYFSRCGCNIALKIAGKESYSMGSTKVVVTRRLVQVRPLTKPPWDAEAARDVFRQSGQS